jgi:hypothetical protein
MLNVNITDAASWTRRRFLKVGSSGALGVGLADMLRAESVDRVGPPRATGVIFLWLSGGPATIDMWDPKPESPSTVRGDFKTIPTAIPGVRFSELMVRTASILDRAVVVRSLHHGIPDHLPGTQYVMTGNKPEAALQYPSLGSVAAKLTPESHGMPAYFAVGEAPTSGAGFLGPAYEPFKMVAAGPDSSVNLDGVTLPAEMTLETLERRSRLSGLLTCQFTARSGESDVSPTLSRFSAEAFDILRSNRIARAFALESEPASIKTLYGDSSVGRNAIIARRLIEAGARFVTLGLPGWDTHSGNFTALRGLLPPLDQALAGLIVDLEQRGLLESTIVVCGGEFGRTPNINGAAGRDHWARAMSYFLSGGGLKRGFVHGSTDDRGFDPLDLPCNPDDLAATLLSLIGISASSQLQTSSGRPIKIVKSGRILSDLIS